MSKKKTKELLSYAKKPGMTEVEGLKAELDMALGILIKQRSIIAVLRTTLKKHKIEDHTLSW